MKVDGLNKWIKEWYDLYEDELKEMMHDIWAHPEVGLDNKYAAERSADFAKKHGFPDALLMRAGKGVQPSDDPNTVYATYGSGKPVIAIVGELDALPGLGNGDVPYREEVEGPGHGCGHNLIAGSCMGAACALRYAMEKEGVKGTLKLVEAPGEEVGRGKSLLAFDGVWKDCDLCIMWHPGSDAFSTEPQLGLVIMAGSFKFYGKSAHAAGAPWNGRSALDAVQLMNMGCEFLREHVLPTCKIHYQITNGGGAPNIVPDYASVKYFCRAVSTEVAQDLFKRVCQCADGAAVMTDTKADYGLIFQIPYFYVNTPLSKFMDKVAQEIPDVDYSDEDFKWAEDLYKSYFEKDAPAREELLPPAKKTFEGITPDLTCTDAADMSYFCPTAHIHGGGVIAGSPGHHWTITACSGTDIGMKAAVRAGKVLAESAFEAFGDEEMIKEAWADFKSQNIPTYDELYSMPMKPEAY
ncbi:MAG: amidohydrolase [Oscillospiraceae bacterium]|nr:amidohydrolase [Oscillospiraceae bacterium]